MALPFQPPRKRVLMCDFRGLVEPEMVKRRPVVIFARHKHNSQLVTVVPLSTTEPHKVDVHHHQLSRNPCPDEDPEKPVWAKCDMLYTLSTHRLELYKVHTRQGRKYVNVEVSADDFEAIRRAVAAALSLPWPTPEEG